MCMVARGVEQHGSATVTVGARGGLAVEGAARRELLGRLAGG
jgi:GTP cyclohydrolase I